MSMKFTDDEIKHQIIERMSMSIGLPFSPNGLYDFINGNRDFDTVPVPTISRILQNLAAGEGSGMIYSPTYSHFTTEANWVYIYGIDPTHTMKITVNDGPVSTDIAIWSQENIDKIKYAVESAIKGLGIGCYVDVMVHY
jgi:hypothetical protein